MTPEVEPAPNSLRARVIALTEHERFRNFILYVIVFNAIILGLETSKAAMATAGNLLIALDKICLGIFIVELALKLYAQRLSFFRQGWNIFDFVIIAIALMPSSGGLAVLRALRILRVLRVISILPSMRQVVQGLLTALPGMGSVVMLMSMIFYVASVMATKLFGETHPQWFGTIGESAYSLFQIMTLESWSMGIVRPVMEEHPQAWLFFIPFIIVTTFAVVNLVVGLVVNSMEGAFGEEKEQATDDYRHDVLDALARIESRLDKLEGKKDSTQAPAPGE
ncbi:MAG: ion transporter [Pikeienuella sp.]